MNLLKRISIKLAKVLEDREKTQAQLADAIEVRRATIHDLYHDKSKQIPRNVLDKIINELNITDMNELLEIVDASEEAADEK